VSAYLLAVVLAVGLGSWAWTEVTAWRRLGWGIGSVLAGVGAVALGVRAVDRGSSATLLLVLTALLGYVAWQAARRLRDAAAVPHWTTAAAGAAAALLLEGHVVTIALGGSLGWVHQALAIAGFGLIGPATIAWGIVGSLWLRHRARAVPPTAAESADALDAPTVRIDTRATAH